MVFKWTGSHLGRDGRTGAGLSVLVVAVGCICVAADAARAQTCPTTPGCTTDAQCHEQPNDKFCTVDYCFNPGPSGWCMCAHSNNQCEDGLFCNGIGYCDVNTDSCKVNPTNCQAPTPYCDEDLNSCVQCLQHDQCTPLYCDTSSGTCVECLSDFQCQDVPVPLVCNGFESCSADGLCQAGTPPNCPKKCFLGTAPPGTTCTTDANCGTGGKCLGFCSELRGGCVQCDHDSGCDDGKFCNGGETCQNDQCAAGTPPVCKKCVNGPDNLQPCSTDADCRSPGTCTGGPSYCEEGSNRCVQCLNASQCDDFNFCTSNACVFNSCAFTGNQAICSDGLFCNGDEVCTYQLGNPCSIFGDRDHCCFAGTPPNCADNYTCTVDSCNETIDSCQRIPGDANCSDGLGCTGTETCGPGEAGADPVTGCKPGTPFDCSSLDTDCSEGGCVELPTVHCQSQPIYQGVACDDDNPCTALSKCNNGFCVDNPPASNDPYRCVKLEWRASGPTTVLAGSTVELGLYAVANSCSTPHDSNWRCVGGAANGITCTTDANCRICVGGTNPGTECTGDGWCSGGGTCPPGGTCTDLCPLTSLPVSSIDALFSWNKTFLQLNPSTIPNPNPQDACVQPTACTACPINTYNWSGTGGFSGWINDCTGDGLNVPCTPPPRPDGVPMNDGNARYLAFQGIQDCPEACATTAGLKVSTIKFKAISGGTSQIALLPCFGEGSKTQVQTAIVVPGALTSDVTKSLGPAVTITVTCDSDDDCNDNNVCTNDSCNCTIPNCGGTCQHVNTTGPCDDGLFCTTNDLCSGGVCQGGAATCKTCTPGGATTGKPCSVNAQCESPGTCTGAPSFCEETNDRCVECLSAADCNDGVGNTVDTCVKTCSGGDNIGEVCTVIEDCPGPGGACESDFCENTPIDCNDNVACTVDVSDPVDGHCTNTPDDAFCNPTGSFCSSAVCDPVDDCVFDHECISTNGNPCPDPATCNEESRTCGGCEQPTAVGISCRYLAVTPADQGSTPVALVVAGDCGDPSGACVYRYVQSKCNGGANNGLDCLTDADCPKRCAGGLNPGSPCTTSI
ncbi:MAG: hypothetical protein V1790_05770, partial [Planctomycetota bacterium]